MKPVDNSYRDDPEAVFSDCDSDIDDEKLLLAKARHDDEENLLSVLDQKQQTKKSNQFTWGGCLKVLVYFWSVVTMAKLLYGCYRDISFHRSNSDTPTAFERTYLDALNENRAAEWSKKYSSVLHIAGKGSELVDFTVTKFKEFNLQTRTEQYDVFLNYPIDSQLLLLNNHGKIEHIADLKEDVLEHDPTTGGDGRVPVFHGYSANGNVTANYVYVNYGRRSDFELLQSKGIDLQGKIAIVRYGKIFRGLKVKFAEEFGITGVLMYSDPYDDNYRVDQGFDSYPDGPARNPSSVERGSVQFISEQPGDPTTPGYPSQGDVQRRAPDHIPKIPSLPVSIRDIQPILEKLSGHGINPAGDEDFEGWLGALPDYCYCTGPNEEYEINLYNEQEYNVHPIYNIYGKIEGKNKNDGYILVGNHRDAWTKGGASDPNSGSATMLEVIRGLHELSKTGWTPERTIVFASWDGEEYGLLGSTEFGEKYSTELKKNCLAYINLDVAVGGSKLNIDASPLLNHLLEASLDQVAYPGKEDESLYQHFFKDSKGKIGILGSGSDYTVFLEHLGIPSADIGFVEGKDDGVYNYHSDYDSYHWMSTVLDPGFKFHQAIAKYLGLTILKLSERKVLDFKTHTYAIELGKYYHNLIKRVPESWKGEKLPSKLFMENKHNGHHKTCHRHDDDDETIGDYIIHTRKLLKKLLKRTGKFDQFCNVLQEEWDHSYKVPLWKRIILALRIRRTNYQLRYFERAFLNEHGLKNRPWFKHIVFAAGRDTGYEGFALPGIKEALDDNSIDDFVEYLKILHIKLSFLSHSIKPFVSKND